jgi:hypothetical protein
MQKSLQKAINAVNPTNLFRSMDTSSSPSVIIKNAITSQQVGYFKLIHEHTVFVLLLVYLKVGNGVF